MDEKQNHSAFLYGVSQYVEDNPSVAAYVSDAVSAGLQAAQAKTLERAADMEVALSLALGRKSAHSIRTILSKLRKWEGRSAVRWEAEIERLSEETNP